MDKVTGGISQTGQRKPFKVIYLGDSLVQGTQDGFTVGERQAHAWPQLLSRAFGIEANAPYISPLGLPFNPFEKGSLDIKSLSTRAGNLTDAVAGLALETFYNGTPATVDPAWVDGGEGARLPESLDTPEHPQNNFGMFGVKSRHILNIRTEKDMLDEIHSGLLHTEAVATEVPQVHAVLQNGGSESRGSEVDQAIAAHPDAVMVWGGANDMMQALRYGYVDHATLTPIADQHYTYQVQDPFTHEKSMRTSDQVLPGFESIWLGKQGIVPRLLSETDADVFVLTVPRADLTPFMGRIGQAVGQLPFKVLLSSGVDVTQEVEKFVIPGKVKGAGKDGRQEFPANSEVSLFNVMTQLETAQPMNTLADLQAWMQKGTTNGLFSEDEVVDPEEQATVYARTNEFNDVLQRAATLSPRVHVIDVNPMFQLAHDKGIELTGVGDPIKVTDTFTGVRQDGMEGLYSYDGLHPSDTGHALIANFLLGQMKQAVAGQPRFEAITQAAPVDEKAAFNQDPHHLAQMG